MGMLYGEDKPLIVSALWSSDEIPQIDSHIKDIIKLFLDYISIDFPRDKLEVLAVCVMFLFHCFTQTKFEAII